jgi:hypothetical protein
VGESSEKKLAISEKTEQKKKIEVVENDVAMAKQERLYF